MAGTGASTRGRLFVARALRDRNRGSCHGVSGYEKILDPRTAYSMIQAILAAIVVAIKS